MTERSPLKRAREEIVGIVSMLVTGVFLVALFTGRSWWLPFMLFGYIVLVPLTAILFGDEEDVEEWVDDAGQSDKATDSHAAQDRQDALETLRDRYARGELTDEQFERKVERLLETETLEDVEAETRSDGVTHSADSSEGRELERERS